MEGGEKKKKKKQKEEEIRHMRPTLQMSAVAAGTDALSGSSESMERLCITRRRLGGCIKLNKTDNK